MCSRSNCGIYGSWFQSVIKCRWIWPRENFRNNAHRRIGPKRYFRLTKSILTKWRSRSAYRGTKSESQSVITTFVWIAQTASRWSAKAWRAVRSSTPICLNRFQSNLIRRSSAWHLIASSQILRRLWNQKRRVKVLLKLWQKVVRRECSTSAYSSSRKHLIFEILR